MTDKKDKKTRTSAPSAPPEPGGATRAGVTTVCSVCGAERLTEARLSGDMPVTSEQLDGWLVHDCRIRLTGICPKCRQERDR